VISNESSGKSNPSEERLRMSAAYLFVLKLPNGKFVFTLGEHEAGKQVPLIRPIGGAWKYTELPNWEEKTGFYPERDDGDLRGTVTRDKLSAFREELVSKRDMERDPRRELYEELGIHLGLTQEEVNAWFDPQFILSKEFESDANNTHYFHEYYVVTINDPAVCEKIESLVRSGTAPVCIIDQKQLMFAQESAKTISVSHGIDSVEAVVAPTCFPCLQSEYRPPTSNSFSNKNEKVLQDLLFQLEKRLHLPYRITQQEVELLHRHGDPKLVSEFMSQLVQHRLWEAVAQLVIGPAAQGLGVLAATLPNNREVFFSIALAGLGLRNWLRNTSAKGADELVRTKLSLILHQIKDQSFRDRLDDEHLDTLVADMAVAEQVFPPIIALLTSAGFISAALLSQRMYSILAGFYLSVLVGSVALQEAIGRKPNVANTETKHSWWKSLGLSELLLVAPSIVANFASYAPHWIALLTAFNFGAESYAGGMSGIGEIKNGQNASKSLKEWLSGISFSLTPKKYEEHSLRIRAQEDVGMVSTRVSDVREVFGVRVESQLTQPCIRYSKITQHDPLDPWQEKGIRPTQQVLYVKSFSLPVRHKPDVVILQDASLVLRQGVVNIFRRGDEYGCELALSAIAGEVEHPTGTVLLRKRHTDVNTHELEHGELRNNIKFFEANDDSMKKPLPKVTESQLRESEIFSEEEIARYLKGHHDLGQVFRVKVRLVAALNENIPVIFIHMNLRQNTSLIVKQKMAAYISSKAHGRIVALVMKSAPGLENNLFPGEVESYKIIGKKFRKDTTKQSVSKKA
jgi:hypothetical protein